MINVEKIKQKVLSLLEKGLSNELTYHSIDHTLYVLKQSEKIAQHEQVGRHEFKLLQIAALFHDIGFINTYLYHEAEGCVIAKNILPEYGLSTKDIDSICGMIMTTKIPQNPTNLLEYIIADADLEYLGTSNYTKIASRLKQELLFINPLMTDLDWIHIQIKFLENHQYFTPYCIKNREEKKQQNLAILKQSFP